MLPYLEKIKEKQKNKHLIKRTKEIDSFVVIDDLEDNLMTPERRKKINFWYQEVKDIFESKKGTS